MKILHIISSPAAGGAEVYVKDLTKSLAKKNHEVHIGFLNNAKDIGRNSDYEKKFIKELEENNIKYFFIGYETRKKPWLGIWRTLKYVRKNNIDIYHTHLAFGIIFSLFIKKPVFYTHHTSKPLFNKLTYHIFNQLVSSYIGISKICSENLRKYTGKKVTTILNGVDTKKILYKKHNKNNHLSIRLISVGRFHPQKNYPLLIEAIENLPEKTKSIIHLRIAGEGSDKEKISKLIKEKKLDGKIELLGNRNDIPELLNTSDIFVMSSDVEGLPIALIEATLTGLPCIVTDVGGCSEVINLCQNGIIVPPKNSAALTEAINKLVTKNELLNQLSTNALNNSNIFSIESACQAHIEVYQQYSNKKN